MPDPTILQRLEALTLKVDSPERLAMLQQFGKEHYADAGFLNLLVEALINMLSEYVEHSQPAKKLDVISVDTLDDIVFPASNAVYVVANDTTISSLPQLLLCYCDGAATEKGDLYVSPFMKLSKIKRGI